MSPRKAVHEYLVLIALAVIPCIGCGTAIHYLPTHPRNDMSPRPAEQVELYTATLPARPHQEVGMFEAHQESEYSFDDMHQIISKMRNEAGKLGCHALVITGSGDVKWDRKGYRGTCLVYTDQGTTAAPQGLSTSAAPTSPAE